MSGPPSHGEAFSKLIHQMPKGDDCWIYNGPSRNGGKHAYVYYEDQYYQAHRLSYILLVGPIPDGMCILHKCDEGFCVNPQHLFVGTRADNVRDMVAKRRNKPQRGMDNGRSVLTVVDVAEIKQLGKRLTQSDIADKYGVSPSQISRVLSGKQWRQE